MQKRKLGATGPEVSLSDSGPIISAAASIWRLRAQSSTRRSISASRLSTPLTSTEQGRLGGGSRQCPWCAAQEHRAGDQIWSADGRCGKAPGCVAPLHHAGRRSESAAAEDRLDRSLPVAPARCADAYRGNPARPRRPREAGKVRFIGCSNFSAAQLKEAQDASARNHIASFVCCQEEYSLLERGLEKELLPTSANTGWACYPISRSPAGC